ncbi:hypothetical protein BH23VER1_BH23VER1_34780 [soil metagenome]
MMHAAQPPAPPRPPVSAAPNRPLASASWILLALLTILPAGLAQGAPDRALRSALDSAYSRWRQAMVAEDANAWSAATAPSRHAMTRNLIVSQRLPWPASLFQVPVIPPETSQLTLIDARQKGPTALVAYLGGVDFGVTDSKLPENVLVIYFLESEGRWRFDRIGFVNLNANPDVRAAIRKNDTSWLDSPRYALTGSVPPTPKPCPKPEYLGHVQVVSIGYKTDISINGGIHTGSTIDTIETNVIIGGLKPGENKFRATIEPTEIPEDVDPYLEISVFATSDLEGRPPARVFHYIPHGDVPPLVSTAVWVTPTTLKNVEANQ